MPFGHLSPNGEPVKKAPYNDEKLGVSQVFRQEIHFLINHIYRFSLDKGIDIAGQQINQSLS